LKNDACRTRGPRGYRLRRDLIDMCVLMSDDTEKAALLTVNDAIFPYDVPSLMPVP